VIAPRTAFLKCLALSLLFAIVLSHYTARASDWIGTPLSKLIGTSELIAFGSVKEVLDSTILFQVTRQIGGEKADLLEIAKAKADPFASVKPAPYQAGQSYLLFLVKSKNTSPKVIWQIMGQAQEAQMPVSNNYIYFNDRYFEGLPMEQQKVNGVELNIQRFEFPLFLNAVEEYKKCYQWTRREDHDTIKQLCDDNQLTVYGEKSFIHNFLVMETRTFIRGK